MLAYDFRNKKQLEDFDLKGNDTVLIGGTLQLPAGKSIQHLAAFKTVAVRGVLTGKPDGTFLKTTSGIYVQTYVFTDGSTSTERCSYLLGRPNQSTSAGGNILPPIGFNLVVGPQKVLLQWHSAADVARLNRRTTATGFGEIPGIPRGVSFLPQSGDFPVGHLELQGGKSGLTLCELWIFGELDTKR